MIAGGFIFAVMTVLIRPLSETVHAFEIVFFRNLFGLLMLAPWIIGGVDLRFWRSPNVHLHLLRSAAMLGAMLCWFSAVPLLPLVQAISLNFTAPIFVTLLAALLLRETVRARRWAAVGVGFLGVLVIMRPGFDRVGLGQVLVLGDAMCWALAIVLVRLMARREPAKVILVYMFLLVLPLSAVPAAMVWTWPDANGWLLLVALSACSTVGHYCATRAFVVAEPSAIMPFDYLRMLWYGGAGWLLFGEVPSGWTLIGGVIIVGSSLYIVRREVQLARERARKDLAKRPAAP